MLSKKLTLPALAFATLALGACSTPTSGLVSKSVIDGLKPITMSRKDTCQTQIEIAEHNTRLEAIKSGKDVTYKAPCQVEEQKVAAK